MSPGSEESVEKQGSQALSDTPAAQGTDGESPPELAAAPEAGQDPAAASVTGAPGETPASADEPGGEPKKPGKSAVREWAETLVVALLVALLIRSFVVQVYLVEGPSMEPTLHTFERVFVNKLVYRFRAPKPGEIIVLQDPARPQRELIKRVIAVAGETIEIRKGIVYVDGKPLKEPFINTAIKSTVDMDAQPVPENHVFVMGDNRGMSFDSRSIGPIEVSKIDGKAFFMFWPVDKFAYGPLDQPRQIDPTITSLK
ncbi:MAG: signal peptidase [Symbiobacteriaceae bacterium]|jgi:signal peptidase I|nr:signal peptidase [Symbiobacteriaceae bacterium]